MFFMTIKFVALISVVELGIFCVVQAQSRPQSESAPETPPPAQKAASLPASGPPAAAPRGHPTPKKRKTETKPRPTASPVAAGRTVEEAANPPAPGGGQGQVWINTETGVYHREGSRFYGTTRKGKYMTEQDAIQAGYKPAPKGP